MTPERAQAVLDYASRKADQGVYAVKHKGYIEIKFIPMTRTQLKRARREAKRQGVKLYVNGI